MQDIYLVIILFFLWIGFYWLKKTRQINSISSLLAALVKSHFGQRYYVIIPPVGLINDNTIDIGVIDSTTGVPVLGIYVGRPIPPKDPGGGTTLPPGEKSQPGDIKEDSNGNLVYTNIPLISVSNNTKRNMITEDPKTIIGLINKEIIPF